MESNEPEVKGRLLESSLSRYGPIILLILITANIVPAFLLRIVGGIMYPFFIVVFFWSALYIFTITIAMKMDGMEFSVSVLNGSSKLSLLVLVLLSIIPRLAWIGSEFLISLDAVWYIDFGKFMSWGDMPYADFYFPYPPVFGYFVYVIMLIAPAIDSYRILAVIFDVAIVVALWQMARSGVISDRLRIAPLVYAILPFAIIESGFNGHFEPLANIFIILSLWLVMSDRVRLSGVFLGLSAATKVYAVFLLPVYLLIIPENRKKLEVIGISGLAAYLTFIPFSIPVWLRGDLLFPGTAMPGSTTGFFDALFGFIFNLAPLHLLTIAAIGVGALALIVFMMLRSLEESESRFGSPLLYDIITLSLGVVFVVMIILVWVYPLLPPGPGVFWRYPFDVALARGLSTITGTLFLIWMAWKRWRKPFPRSISNKQLALVASILLMLLVAMSKQVFYGWYLLWVLPPLFLIKDRRFVYLALACMLLLYPSYTHDNFLTLGYDEDKTWSDPFSDVNDWAVSVDLSDTNLSMDDVDVGAESIDGVGAFSVDTSEITNESARFEIAVTWSRDVDIPITPQTEFVIRESAEWDPTFERYCDVELYFVGTNSTGHAISWPIIAEWQHAPSNITFWLWRFTFSGQGIQVHPTELTQLRIVIDNIRRPQCTFLVDFMYTTEVVLFSPSSIVLVSFLAIPNILAVLVLERYLPRENEWYSEENKRRS
ncbi:MAG: glycosyltransferase 87 family protein [Candidatus Thorarchaeota archaeon]